MFPGCCTEKESYTGTIDSIPRVIELPVEIILTTNENLFPWNQQKKLSPEITLSCVHPIAFMNHGLWSISGHHPDCPQRLSALSYTHLLTLHTVVCDAACTRPSTQAWDFFC
jgi:hypothetical protein